MSQSRSANPSGQASSVSPGLATWRQEKIAPGQHPANRVYPNYLPGQVARVDAARQTRCISCRLQLVAGFYCQLLTNSS
jgi:hypothetical protein